MVRSNTGVIIFCMVLYSCRIEQKTSGDPVDQLLDLIITQQSSETIEFHDLYNHTTDTIAEDKYEKSELVQKLKLHGFTITDWGRGNYEPLGPRIITYTMQKDDCSCEVNKIYYYSPVDTIYNMSETISCSHIQQEK